jgi:hypothetical protein
MSDGFLGRWSQRKRDAQAGRLDGDAPLNDMPPAVASPAKTFPVTESVESTPSQGVPEREPPTLADTAQLTPESDFQPFMAKDVASEVRNAAMKKLFTDPHFNVMDGLDIYIGDYNTPDPLPPEMLRQMVGAQFLGLWDDEAKVSETSSPTPSLSIHTSPDEPVTPPSDHDHTDLRLQPNPTPADPEPQSSTG